MRRYFLRISGVPARHRGDRFSRSVQEPASESRRLHTGCHLGLNQAGRAAPGLPSLTSARLSAFWRNPFSFLRDFSTTTSNRWRGGTKRSVTCVSTLAIARQQSLSCRSSQPRRKTQSYLLLAPSRARRERRISKLIIKMTRSTASAKAPAAWRCWQRCVGAIS
jgi:hypothetical protein